VNIPDEAMAAASFAMREVTPPPGVSKADWLAEHGPLALLAGAVAAAAPYLMALGLDRAADDAERIGLAEIPVHSLRHRANCHRSMPHGEAKTTILRLNDPNAEWETL
jgi:hypothetical protein